MKRRQHGFYCLIQGSNIFLAAYKARELHSQGGQWELTASDAKQDEAHINENDGYHDSKQYDKSGIFKMGTAAHRLQISNVYSLSFNADF